ncbi:putative lipoyltransferase and lipoate-protein ligase [Phyllosticta citriasiana]|uniref:Putative lipoate-protein ligase A n=1 Tax=Phyllosticta citriasiana TaxID=595635 RepID=A0ABR1KX70_9PEZI
MQRLSLRLPRLSRPRQHEFSEPGQSLLGRAGTTTARGPHRFVWTACRVSAPSRPSGHAHQRSRQTRHARRASSTSSSPTSSQTTPLHSSQEPATSVSSLLAANPSRRSYIFVSTTSDPYLNLSIEATLLARSAAHTAILFTYINRPCVVIGRNQNPWVEVDLARLRRQRREPGSSTADEAAVAAAAVRIQVGDVDLVRRRSGGGAVFHDAGNVNWSVISPSNDFTRDKHGEMVVRALRGLGVSAARVNARHDIVVDSTPYPRGARKGDEVVDVTPRKVSGSAYKLTRGRALHHGTCLLASPHLAAISQYLRAPAKPYIRAQGVESVRSPVANVGVDQTAFVEAVRREFGDMYCQDAEAAEDDETVVIEVGEEQLQDPEVKKGYEEMKVRLCCPSNPLYFQCHHYLIERRELLLCWNFHLPQLTEVLMHKHQKTLEWTYLQTPRFKLSVPPEADDEGSISTPPQTTPTELPPSTRISLNVRHGVLENDSTISLPTSTGPATLALQPGHALHQIADWRPLLQLAARARGEPTTAAAAAAAAPTAVSPADVDAVAAWLARMLPRAG